MLRKLFDFFFRLPPIEERHITGGWVRNTFYNNLVKEKDDTYIYYLALRNSFILTFAFFCVYLVSFVTQTPLNLYFFVIDIPSTGGVEQFLKSLSWNVSGILLYIMLPYYILLYRLHINPAKYDVLWCSPKYKKPNERRPKRHILVIIPTLVAVWYVMRNLYLAFMLLAKYFKLYHSILYLVMCLPIFSGGMAIFFWVTIMGIITIWHIMFNLNGYKETDASC